ncbi:MAG: hypothetical protein V8T85_12195 [Blautia faecicola]
MKIVQKIKEWKRNRPKFRWSKKKLVITGVVLVVVAGLAIGGKILVDTVAV